MDPTQTTEGNSIQPHRTIVARSVWRLGAASGSIVVIALTGCESDSFIDPSVVGRWEHTPTKVPVLERIASIEEATGDLVEHSAPTREDLFTDPRDYRVGAGDVLQIEIWDFVQSGQPPEKFDRVVDPIGMIELPQLGRLFLSGKSVEQVRDLIADGMKKYISDPLVAVVVKELRNQTYTIIGAVDRPGPYFIPSIDYKLIEAITAGGRIDDDTKEVFVIRQVVLDERAMNPRDTRRSPVPGAGPTRPPSPGGAATPTERPKFDEPLTDLIDRLSEPKNKTEGLAPGAAPAALTKAAPLVELPDALDPVRNTGPSSEPSITDSSPNQIKRDERLGAPAMEPMVELPENGSQDPTILPQGSWVFLSGKWVRLAVGQGPKAVNKKDHGVERPQVVAQRVIRIPFEELMDGDTSLNIVIRPGDIIRVPSMPRGEIYVAGHVARPGVYNLSKTGRLTLLRAVTSAAGGLSNLAIPERVDLIRVVGDGQQAMVRLDMRAIAEGTQPDVYLKADDMVNVGTNFWALPLAVIRNGFRANYGWGLVIDRNFGSDIFGVPPGSRGSRNNVGF